MKKNVAYIVVGAVLLYLLFKPNRSKAQSKENGNNTSPDDDITDIGDVLKSTRNFNFFYKQEENAFNTQYDKQYTDNSPSPKNGDLLVIYWAIPERNIERKSTFQFMNREWRRFSNFAKSQNLKNKKWVSLKTQK